MLRTSLVLLLIGSPVLASSAVQMDVPALTRAASDVVRARVTSSRCAWTEDHLRLVTHVEVEVLERWKGAASGRLSILQPGGELDGIGQTVSGVAPLAVGDDVVLFVERQGPVHRVVGLAQGVYRVERTGPGGALRAVPASLEGLELVAPPGEPLGPRAPSSLDALRDAVRKARPR